TVYRFDATANYKALQVTLKRRTSSGLQYQAFYTLSKSMDTKSTIAGGETRQEPNTVLDFLNPGRDRGPSSFDARHNLVLTSTYPFPFSFQQKAVGMILEGGRLMELARSAQGSPLPCAWDRTVPQTGTGGRLTVPT